MVTRAVPQQCANSAPTQPNILVACAVRCGQRCGAVSNARCGAMRCGAVRRGAVRRTAPHRIAP
eukprot:6813489-Prymnesium_polylepis.1